MNIIITRGVVINGINRIEIFIQEREAEVKIILWNISGAAEYRFFPLRFDHYPVHLILTHLKLQALDDNIFAI